TTLAVRAAHLLRSDFPDGQLYASLRGAEDKPLDPGEVLAAFLRALGVDGTVIPEDAEERAALYRSRLADRRMLVLLDDVASDAQARPLLPGAPGCAVLTTSRPRLAGLPGTHLLDLDILSEGNAVELLANVAGRIRVQDEPGAARVIARLCGFLPLALRIAAGRLAARPHWPLSRMAAQLNDERGRLDELRLGELAVRASLALSYQGLDDTARMAFRRLGVLEVEDVTGWLCAALLDIPPDDAEAVLDELVDAQLLDVVGTDPGRQYRYRFHDLVRVYARERAAAEETEAELDATLHRTLGAWLALAEQANRELQGPAYWVAHGDAPRWHVDPKRVEALLADPFGWFESERVSLLTAVEQACEVGCASMAWDLANSLAFFVELRGYYGDWRHSHELALAAAKRSGDRRGQGVMLRGLGRLHTIQGRYEDARRCLDAARAAFVDVRDRHGDAQVRCRVGLLERALLRPAEAERCFTEALVIFRQLGDQPGQAYALHLLGVMHLEQGRYGDATVNLEAGLAGFRATGYRTGEALVLHRLGALHQARGNLDEAVSSLRRCLVILDELGERHEHTETLAKLASVYFDQGRAGESLRLLQRCLATFRELGERHLEGKTLRSLGQVYFGIGDEEAARACREQAFAVFRELGVREADELPKPAISEVNAGSSPGINLR
ncbi:MAG: ATP-binding protein, partial [Sciscionella sp.]